MVKSGIYKTEAVVLSTHNLGETSRIADLYTERWGRLSAVAKGARRPKSIFGASLEMFTHLHLILYMREGKSLAIISQAEIINPFGEIRNDPGKIACGCYLVELVKAMVKGSAPDCWLFRLILRSLAWLEEEKENKIFIHTVNLKLMKVLGLGPEVGVCVRCRREIDGVVRFSSKGGGVLCKDCRGDGAIEISKGTLTVMRRLLELEPQAIKRIKLGTKIEEELKQALGSYLEYHLPYPLRSLKVLEDIGNW